MTLAVVETLIAGHSIQARLDGARWSAGEHAALARILDRRFSLGRFGPSNGDPVTCAAHEAAELLGGRIVYLRPVPPRPPGADF